MKKSVPFATITYEFQCNQLLDNFDQSSVVRSKPFNFLIRIPGENHPQSWEEAYELLESFRDDFIAACVAAYVSSPLYVLLDEECKDDEYARWMWGYIAPEIRVDGTKLFQLEAA